MTGAIGRNAIGPGAIRPAPRRVRLVSWAVRVTATTAFVAAGAAPAVAQIDRPRLIRTPLAPYVVGNQERLVILPSIQASYDTNTLPYVTDATGSTIQNGSKGNGRITPGVDLALNRQFGRATVGVSGTVGYDFNSRYKYLNQARINLGGTGNVLVGGSCNASASASYQQYRFDQANLTRSVNATSRSQAYDLGLGCNRSAGFSPVAGVSYVKQTNDELPIFGYRTYGERLGVAYALPSLGTVTVTGSAQQIRRPQVENIVGIDDGTDVRQINLQLARAVAPRTQLRIGVGYYNANPKRAGVQSTSGLAYDGQVRVLLTPQFVLGAAASRDITNDNGTSASYVRRDDYSASLDWRLSQKSALNFTGQHTRRSFKGEDLLINTLPIGRDRITQASVNYSVDTLKRFRFTAGVRHIWRNASTSFYDYQTTVFSASIGARF